MVDDRLARLRKTATRPRRTVPVLLDGEVREQIEAVEDELDRIDSSADADRRQNSKSTAGRRAELEAEVAALREQAAESTLYLVLEGLQRTAFRALIAQYPPRKDGDGKVIASDRLLGVDMEAVALPLARACVVGHKVRPDADVPTEPVDREILVWLLGDETTEPFATERQVDQISGAALTLCVGDDAVPLPRRRSPAKTSGGE